MSRRSLLRGLVVSDLHLFARRSNGFVRMESLRSKLSALDCIILNGDIFDFCWSTLPLAATETAALDWLHALLSDFPRCEFHYVMGNHDSVDSFHGKLIELSGRNARFHCHEDYLCLGASLFLHGDCASREMDTEGLHNFRKPWREHRRHWGKLAWTFYRISDAIRLTNAVHRWNFAPQKTVQRLCHYLDHAYPDWRLQIRDCYFGHTHLAFTGYEYEGMRFHNPGSAIKGMEFQPLFIELDTTGSYRQQGPA